jgi:hypothetical protein
MGLRGLLLTPNTRYGDARGDIFGQFMGSVSTQHREEFLIAIDF